MRRDDPQITTQGAYRQVEPSTLLPGPGEGQGGRPRKKQAPRARPRRPTVAARRGLDETGLKNGLGEKVKNPHQLRNPKERLKRKLGHVGRQTTGVGRKPKGRSRTAAGIQEASSGLTRSVKGSPKAKRREGNRGKRPHSGGWRS